MLGAEHAGIGTPSSRRVKHRDDGLHDRRELPQGEIHWQSAVVPGFIQRYKECAVELAFWPTFASTTGVTNIRRRVPPTGGSSSLIRACKNGADTTTDRTTSADSQIVDGSGRFPWRVRRQPSPVGSIYNRRPIIRHAVRSVDMAAVQSSINDQSTVYAFQVSVRGQPRHRLCRLRPVKLHCKSRWRTAAVSCWA
jgi:hypothetical protein